MKRRKKPKLPNGAALEENPASQRIAWKHLGTLVRAFFASPAKLKAWTLLFGPLALSGLLAAVQVQMNKAQGGIFTGLANRDQSRYMAGVWWLMGTFALAIPLGVFFRYAEERFSLLWRRWMTERLLERYFYNRAYYRLRGSTTVDNPDQRITEDVRNFTQVTMSFMLIMLNSTVTVIFFIGVVWGISQTLVWVLVGYALAGTLGAWFIGRKLIAINYEQFQKEADFRYGLVRVRENAESIAFYRGERPERRDLLSRFGNVVSNTLRLIGWNRNLAFFTTSYNYLALAVPILVVAPLFLAGKVEFGVIAQAQGAFAQVLAAMSLIITQFERLSTFAAGVRRLGDLWQQLDAFDEEDRREEEEEGMEVTVSKKSLELEDVTVRTPDRGHELSRNFSFKLDPGESVLIMGESGSGKSSMLRTVAGLWSGASGAIHRPNLNRLMFLPQRPYMVNGSLRDQLTYPQTRGNISDETIHEVLETVNLADVAARVEGDLDRVVDWSNVLSLGEQQRVAFARLILKKPLIAFLDEATSALDEPNEEMLYGLMAKSGISYVSVGHRSTLKEYHQNLVLLYKDGTHEVEKMKRKRPAAKG